MAKQKATDLKFRVPNGNTGQDFEITLKQVSLSLIGQATVALVTAPGKEDEGVIPMNQYENERIDSSIKLDEEGIAQANIDKALLDATIAALTEKFTGKYSKG